MEKGSDISRGKYLLAEEILELIGGEEARLKKLQATYKYVEASKGDKE